MIRILQIILLVILFKYLWQIIKKYWPSVTNINEKPKSDPIKKQNLKIDKSDIEDAEFTELDEDK